MITFAGDRAAAGSARSRVTPISLLDVLTVDGFAYYWSDRPVSGIQAKLTPDDSAQTVSYLPWLMSAPTFTFYRSLQTDVGSMSIQNVSGDTYARDFERVTRRGAIEGAMFVYRFWDVGGEFAWLEVHGTLTLKNNPVRIAELGTQQLFTGQDDAPDWTFSENCQIVWGGKRCGATGSTECLYSYKTCQVTEHFVGILSTYEKNYTETVAAVPTQTINRRRSL